MPFTRMHIINCSHGCLSIVERCLKAVWKIAAVTRVGVLSFTISCLEKKDDLHLNAKSREENQEGHDGKDTVDFTSVLIQMMKKERGFVLGFFQVIYTHEMDIMTKQGHLFGCLMSFCITTNTPMTKSDCTFEVNHLDFGSW